MFQTIQSVHLLSPKLTGGENITFRNISASGPALTLFGSSETTCVGSDCAILLQQ